MASTPPKPKLLDRVRAVCRRRGYSIHTERAYCQWTRRYVRYHGTRHPRTLGAGHVARFLTYLATERTVAPATQNQALSALAFLYQEVLEMELGDLDDFQRAKRPERLPVVLTREEVRAVLTAMRGEARLAASLLYGAGLRQIEMLRLRVKDVDFGYEQITVRDGKGRKDRRTMLPASLKRGLQRQLRKAKAIHAEDLEDGYGAVYLPDALARGYPSAPTEWKWQYVFPAETLSTDPRGGATRRHHRSSSWIARRLKRAVKQAGLTKPATCHTLRHSFRALLLEDGADIRSVQELLGHKDVRRALVYTHVLQRGVATKSPLEELGNS